jgi:CTP:molybdopterin cytidylyltransferase MocA
VAPEVGPAASTGAPTAESHTEAPAAGTEATGVVENPTPGPEASAALPEAPPEQTHPEANIYFAMNGGQPDVVAHDLHAPLPVAAEPQADALPGESAAGTTAAPTAAPAAKIEEPQQPASVEVIFPHDHG